ncbi:hypothetical protein KEJ49_01670 [Candidatus Bathyarchaeota archaeon]|nr:hypothetical protein [Candidatus Bathyarchaeota archaeon]
MSGSRERQEAQITLRYRSEREARAVLDAVSPDNIQAPEGINLTSEASGGELRISITCHRGIKSLTATVDDLLSCIQAAERALEEIQKAKRSKNPDEEPSSVP